MNFSDETLLKLDESLRDLQLVKPLSHDSNNRATTEKLCNEIRNNIVSCDLNLCLFTAALNSYKRHHCLRPFPSNFINEHGKNFNELKNACDNIPPLLDFIKEPKKSSKEVIELLTWLFVLKAQPTFKLISADRLPIPKIRDIFKPHYVFEVCYQKKLEDAWQKRRANKDIIVAFHGSGMENFYSILKVGLQQHFSVEKEVLYGNGIYLSNEISVSAHFASFASSWKNSRLGKKQSIIAVCEIINDIEKVKCRDAKHKKRAINKDSLEEIPQKYFVVTDSEMVRVKYLMVYRKNNNLYNFKSYIKNNMFTFLLIFYIFFIVIIGLFNSNNNIMFIKFTRWLNRYYIKGK